jgi:hypothetical protein
LSTTEGRKQRIERLLQELKKHPSGLEANEIAKKTGLLTEITMDRLYKYLAELEWAGMVKQDDLQYSIVRESSIKNERERKNKTETEKQKEGGIV